MLSVVYVFLSVKGQFEVNWFFVILIIGFFSIFFLFLPYRGRLARRPAQLIGEEAFFVVFRYFIFPLSTIIIIMGILLIVFGWKGIHEAKGEIVTKGIYSYVRHPQYLGFMLLTFGMNLEWMTFFTVLL
jgi:protein-S-isoprenylcysteine O-methyltransferase Ste14